MRVYPRAINYNSSAISMEQFEAHKKLYLGYVDKVNEITNELVNAPRDKATSSAYSLYRGLKKGETFSLNGVIFHEAYFENMAKEPTNIGDRTKQVLTTGFGSYENWLEDFKACAMSARGWCILAYEQRTGTYRNILLDEHDVGPVGYMYPLIILDMYEHAYFYDYKTDKTQYIENFINSIDWNVIENRSSVLLSILLNNLN